MKTIYRIGKGYVQMDSYGEIHKSHYVLKAVLAALIIAASISTIAALVSKYPPVDPQIIKAGKTSVIGY
jgi:capsular polysaccharide biosynthesis protein